MKHTENLLEFISASPSSFHAVENIINELSKKGFTCLFEGEEWNLSDGGKYYVTRNRSSVIAFVMPQKITKARFMVCASHSDSPCFKVKHIPELEGIYTRINTERYGGVILDSWFDRPLSVAGRVMVRTDDGVKNLLVNVDRDLLLIPHVAIHLENPNNGKAYELTSDLVPLYGGASAKGSFMLDVAEAAGVNKDDIISHELFLYNRQEGSVWGGEGEFISSPRLDDLMCVYSTLAAITEANPTDAVPVMYVADNEEVGSSTRQGAGSTFLYDVLSRICDCMGGDIRIAASQSMMLSADNAHAIHPSKPQLSDPTNKPVINGGIVIKYSAEQRYTTDAVSAAVFRELCRRSDLSLQVFANRSDMRGGSTLGNIALGRVPLLSVDIGVAQLAMHSSYETAGTKDINDMIIAMRSFYETFLSMRDGDVVIKH